MRQSLLFTILVLYDGPLYTTQIYVQLVSAAVGANQLRTVMGGWGFLIGSRIELCRV